MGQSVNNASVALTAVYVGLIAATILGTGIGLSGPDQIFETQQGESFSSYVRVWNEGETSQSFVVDITGNVSSMMSVSSDSFTLTPGTQRVISILYEVPSDQGVGTYLGQLVISSETKISSSVSRNIEVKVKAAEKIEMELKAGLNLIGWMGVDCSFSEALGDGKGPGKVWKRNEDGSYTSAEYYESADIWWSVDGTFTGLEYGKPYFFECDSACVLTSTPWNGPSDLRLEPGTNLIVWKAESKPMTEAFPQGPQDYYVTKVWRRTDSDAYEFSQYYPTADEWWSQNPSFNEMEKGGAYFVESLSSVHIPG